jgi:hypothetical protein
VHVLPCKHCRNNLVKTYSKMPITMVHMKSRDSFSRFVYALHEKVNTMLKKTSGLTYEQVRERYEHFRARCEHTPGEKGCTEPMLGKKCKSVISIVPQTKDCPSLKIYKSTLRKKIKSHSTIKCHQGRK